MKNIERKVKLVGAAAIAIWVGAFLANVAVVAVVVWVACHFIAKYW